jgi:glutathione peroxidase
MRKVIGITIALVAVAGIAIAFTLPNKDKKPARKVGELNAKSFYDLSILNIDGTDTINFADFKGKKILCVNVASKCGYTYQYEDLQKLHEKYADKLVIIGFPCNQFMGQEPGTPEEIESFCQKNYGVTFTLSEKIDVKGDNQHPVYQWLTQKENNGKDNYKVGWNFNKFLLDEEGNLIEHFGSKTKPLDEELVSLIEK